MTDNPVKCEASFYGTKMYLSDKIHTVTSALTISSPGLVFKQSTSAALEVVGQSSFSATSTANRLGVSIIHQRSKTVPL